MGRRNSPNWVWRQIWWPQAFAPESALELLDRISADRELGTVAFEARAHRGLINYYVGVHPHHIQSFADLVTSLVPGVRITELRSDARPHPTFSGRLKVSHSMLIV